MLKNETRRIGAYDYTVTQLDAVKGRRALVRLAKIFVPSATSSGDALASVTATGNAALGSIADRLNEADVDYLCDLFAGTTTVSGGDFANKAPLLADIFALHFAGQYKEMGQWLLFALEVNFGGFFKGLGVARPGAPVAASAPSTSPSTSTGTSGG